jgi:hypothetical protein
MVRTETIIAVKDVPKSSKFYQDLLNCKSEHEHPTMLNPEKEVGNGLILFFRVADLNTVFTNARKINATIEKKIHYNENSLKNQFILRDLDNYYVIISE